MFSPKTPSRVWLIRNSNGIISSRHSLFPKFVLVELSLSCFFLIYFCMSKNLKKIIKMIAEVAIGDKRCLFFGQ